MGDTPKPLAGEFSPAPLFQLTLLSRERLGETISILKTDLLTRGLENRKNLHLFVSTPKNSIIDMRKFRQVERGKHGRDEERLR